MKEVKKEIEHIDYITMYQATDGTEFNSKEECAKYEASALGVMRSKVAKLIVFDTRNTNQDAWTLFGGCDDHDIVGFKMPNKEAFNDLCQFFLLECPWYNSDERKEQRDAKIAIFEKAFNKKDIIIFGLNCDGDYYFINSRQNIIDNLNSFDKK